MPAVTRLDPYKNFKYVVKFNNTIVAGVSKVGGLKKTTKVAKHPDDANANAIALEHVRIENQGWRRDPALTIET